MNKTKLSINLSFKENLTKQDTLTIKKIMESKLKFSRETGNLTDNLDDNNEIEHFDVNIVSEKEEEFNKSLNDHQLKLYSFWQEIHKMTNENEFNEDSFKTLKYTLKYSLLDTINDFSETKKAYFGSTIAEPETSVSNEDNLVIDSVSIIKEED